jgi:hypothetical protein
MKKYSVVYCRIPTNFNDDRHAIVEAETPEDARKLVKHQLGDDIPGKLGNYDIHEAKEYKEPAINGKIITMQG